jgi:hypothetical protein
VLQGWAGSAQLPLSLPLPETKVTGESASAGAAPRNVTNKKPVSLSMLKELDIKTSPILADDGESMSA